MLVRWRIDPKSRLRHIGRLPTLLSTDAGTNNECETPETWNTIWLFNIAMENGPFMDDFPSYNLHL